MKKLIFRKFTKDTSFFFLLMCFTIGLIVWTIQAVNYFDFVTQDGHGLRTYFSYTILNFPKIIHRIIPFIYFISLFYMLSEYEERNELLIFWTFGVTKINFLNKVIILSIFLMIFQIFIGSFFSPAAQYKGREFLKNSNIDFFTSLIKEGKFINVVDGLTIFIERKNTDDTFSNIYLDDSSKISSRMIYAKNGYLIDDNKKKIFKLFNGQVINKDDNKINVFEFDQIDFNLADYSTNTILTPKLQEISSNILLSCVIKISKNMVFEYKDNFRCDQSLSKEINQELFKRFYKPLYIPIIGILCCFIIIFPKTNIKYKRNKKIIFLFTFLIIILSETSLRYSSISSLATIFYLFTPLILFILFYIIFYNRVQNV